MTADKSQARKPQLRLVVVGHVDHGKSTLIGRVLHDTNSLPDGKVAELKRLSEKRGMPLEWSFVLDSFQAERDQAITIDTTQIWFRTDHRDVVIIDAPGHREFLKNMISGAAQADAALLVIDAAEGIREQTRRHAYLLHLLGLKQIAVLVNKMDMVDYDATRFDALCRDITDYLGGIGVTPAAIIPISARHGDMIAERGAHLGWYQGPTLIQKLDDFVRQAAPVDQPLRLPIQDVYKFDERRIIVGRVETGKLSVGDRLLFSPHNLVGTVKTIEAWNSPPITTATAGQSIGITLEEQIFVARGDTASHEQSAPMLSNVFRAHIFWLGQKPLAEGQTLKLKLGHAETPVLVQKIEKIINTQDLSSQQTGAIARHDVAEVVLRSRSLLALDPSHQIARTGQFVLLDGFETVGGGTISMDGYPDQRHSITRKSTNLHGVEHLLTPTLRHQRNGHRGGVIWFTGLSGAGKSTLAMRVEQRLFNKGFQVFVLDGDNVRSGLNSDLGFSPEDRAENIRRVGEVAALFAQAGTICITAFISPYQSDRDRARTAAPDAFHEIHIKADLAICEQRDPKGLYRKARAGEIKDFTGISAPYEAPENAELVVDTSQHSIDACVQQIVDYIEQALACTIQAEAS